MKEKLRYLVYFGIIISIELFCSLTLNSMGIRKENILMVFIVGVLLISTFTKGYFYGLLASIVSVLCFNFLYIDPNYDFHISDPNDFTYLNSRKGQKEVSEAIGFGLLQHLEDKNNKS